MSRQFSHILIGAIYHTPDASSTSAVVVVVVVVVVNLYAHRNISPYFWMNTADTSMLLTRLS